jgi:glycogen operon protein
VLGPVNEFRDLVKALHRAGIEVLLDVVFNHTAEDGADGPTLSFKGIDNRVYYHLDPNDEARYVNASGVGNTLNANHTIVRRMILDHLRYWVEHMHVDGFRFDLASALARGRDATPLRDPPLLLDIDSDPILADTKIIAEPWDAAGLYQVGTFVGNRWAVWNGRYRDTVRRFLRGDEGQVPDLADVISGSERVFGQACRDPLRSVNFVTAHDGFTLNDLVSYDHKHNEDNGHGNADGGDYGDSWNCGVEGPTDDPEVLALRARQIRNFLTILLLSQGRPMIVMGDELCRTQRGNNNSYCQDNEISWLDWNLVKEHADVLRFVRSLLRLRHESILYEDRLLWRLPGGTDVFWHGVETGNPDWGDSSRSLAFELFHLEHDDRLYVALNAWKEPLTFEVPIPPPGLEWGLLIDTSRAAPEDFQDPPAPIADESSLTVAPYGACVLRTR